MLSAVFAVALAGCALEPLPVMGGFPVVETQRFRVYAGERLLGYLRDVEIQHPEKKVCFYRVEAPNGAWVGNVDEVGRFYKSLPFQEEPRLLGMYAWDPGLQLLFETEDAIRILPMRGEGAPAEATARRILREARAARMQLGR